MSCLCKNLRFSKFFKWHLYNYEDCLWSKFQLNLTFFTGVIALNPRKWAHRVMNQKNLFLLGKVKNPKYSKAETWHPESIDRRSYYRLCENFWWPFGTAPRGQFRPNWAPPPPLFILLNFTRIRFFWDLRLTLFDIHANAVFQQNFWFPGSKWGPKVDQNRNLSVSSIWAKFQGFEGFF